VNKNIYLNAGILAFTTVAALGSAVVAYAQNYPTKAVRFVIAFTPGGPSDILTRLVGGKLSESMGQPFIFDNRPGAGGNIAGEITAKSPPDGYTILMGNNSILATNAALYKNMSFDPVKDLAPVALIASQPNILVVHPTLPVKSVKELVALAKSKPGQLNYASSGSGAAAHLAAELFQSMTATKMVHIPYKGAGPALIDTLAGQCQVMFATSLSVASYIRSEKVRALAVSTGKRSQSFPNLPTIAEAGVPGFEATTWHGVVAPAGTPAAIIGRLNSEINKLLQAPDMRERLTSQGAEIIGGTPQEFAGYIQREIPKWTKVIKDSGARAD
jgi:tripartite-type tricarboxylate transporter receptor subunit TctC